MSGIRFDAVDLFAGPGGWDIAAKQLGLRVMGIEFDDAACATRRAAGLNTLKSDVTLVDPMLFEGTPGLIASPPCQTFSAAGKGAGRKALDDVFAAIDEMAAGRDPWDFIDIDDPRTRLVLEPLRWAIALEPEWIAWEQVPTVLPVWERCAEVLRSMGYSVATGNVQAEQYGVPQTRKRAVLVARKAIWVGLPEPTHTKYAKGKPRQQGHLLPWVSMADALGWGMDPRPSMTVTGGGHLDRRGRAVRQRGEGRYEARDGGRSVVVVSNYGTGGDASNRGERRGDEPSATVTSKIDRFRVEGDREAFTDEGQQRTYVADVADFKPWTTDRPATTVATRDLVPDPGANANRFNGATKSRNDGVRVTVEEASLLQSFPPDYPWQGTKTKQFQQVGNAIPPELAKRVLLAALGHPHADAVDTWQQQRGETTA